MSEKIITSYDIVLANMLRTSRQMLPNDKIAVVVDDIVFAEAVDDGWIDAIGDEDAEVYRYVSVYDPKLGKEIRLDNEDYSSQIGDVVAYETRADGAVMVKNFTREPKERLIRNVKRAYNVVFGAGYNNGGKGGK